MRTNTAGTTKTILISTLLLSLNLLDGLDLKADSDLRHSVEVVPAPITALARYEVRRDDTLGEISMRIYGTSHRWRNIADWNQIAAPYRLKPGQMLMLAVAPTVSPEEGDKRLLSMWQHRFGVDADADFSRQQDLQRRLASYITTNSSGRSNVLIDEPTHHAEIVELSSQ